ncbi:MAG: I78 family peptidase inhibitor [Pseudomonadota bacterium]
MTSRSLILSLILAVAACAASDSSDEAQASEPKAKRIFSDQISQGTVEETPCGAEGYQSFVGQPLAAVTYPDDLRVRVLRPGAMVTMEYSAERMNIHVDKDGTITKVICG